MLTYNRITGNLSRDGQRIGKCYSGRGIGLDNPAMENVPNTGPLPGGEYVLRRLTPDEIAQAHEGPDVYDLIPDALTKTYGRAGFRLHWDNIKQDFSASLGCIVPTMAIVFQRVKSGDRLQVL